MEGLIMPTKVRKRGCSSSSSSSSRYLHYRLNKRAIVVSRGRAGLGGSRSGTPAPTWGTALLRNAVDSPKYSQSGKSTQPVSARRLAATLWEMNEIPSPRLSESDLEVVKRRGGKLDLKREKMQSGWGRLRSSSASLPPHLSDPSHSPTVSEVDQSGISSQKRIPSLSRRLKSAEQNAAVFDSLSHASFMEIESRTRPPTSSGSVSGGRNRLKDVSNALTTSKELLKIINRIWAQADQPSSSMSVISALHAEIDRARVQVNQLVHEQRMDKNDVDHLMKCFVEEKMSWKNKEHQAIEAAIASIASELEVERKLRRRLESLNKNLGKELTEMKSSFMKAVNDLESEKRAREKTEQICDELARNVDEDRAEVEKLKSESIKIHEEAEKEREMLELADKLREGSVQMKLSEAKHQFEEKSSAISKLRKQLEVFLGSKKDKDEERATCLSKSNISSHPQDDRDAEDAIDSKANSAESDHHLIELSKNNTSKIHKWAYNAAIAHNSRKLPVDEMKARNSISGQVPRRSTALQRTISEGVEWSARRASHHEPGDGLDRQNRFPEHEKEAHRRSYVDETQRYRAVKGLHDHVLSSPRSSLSRDCYSPSQQQREEPFPPRKSKW